MEFNFLAILVAAIVPIFIGFLWYNPKTFGNAWMHASGLTTESLKGGNMIKIFVVTFILSFMLAFILPSLVIHQMGAYSLTQGDLGALPSYDAFLKDYGMAFRTFKHGTFHGVISGIFLALPIIGINALFERKSAKYIFINSGYWILTLGIMGAIICGWK
ncbi:DUF1761 domain-containing protein [Siansivirga zeaxanthinifaciens]|uniref:DUF1761 domain-containing protein n=1 Tax=Siansivirga zeaxanthinifaciens CC-SAMT-1 TaxID=1454006 RepID=A0A0C5W6V4_9FLAO|nr:DUF1761 domain-containing protein [Siansivirga zeaxanthinifaciens]AJR02898.1 hypothetical protein AW14_03840 [Siansivirga zeaxanthinifaciens CC-SAMT-1]